MSCPFSSALVTPCKSESSGAGGGRDLPKLGTQGPNYRVAASPNAPGVEFLPSSELRPKTFAHARSSLENEKNLQSGLCSLVERACPVFVPRLTSRALAIVTMMHPARQAYVEEDAQVSPEPASHSNDLKFTFDLKAPVWTSVFKLQSHETDDYG